MASNDNVIDLLDDSSGDERGGAPAAAAALAPAATSPARRRRKRRRRVESSGDPANNNAGVAAVPAPNANIFEIDDDSDADGGNDNNGRAGGNDDSVEILSPPAAAAASAAAAPAGGGAAARSPGSSSDGSFIEVISPFTAARQERVNMNSNMDNGYAAASSSKPPADDTPLHRIISIFPDICPRHAREQLRQVGLNPTRIDATDGITPAEEQMISVALSNLVEGA